MGRTNELFESMPIQDSSLLNNWKRYCYGLILLCTVFTLISCHRKNELGIKSTAKADSVSRFSLLIDNGNDKQVEAEEPPFEDDLSIYRDSALAQYKGLKHFTTSCKIRNGKFELEVVSKYSTDIIHPDEGFMELFNTPILMDQKLVFRKGNKILNESRIPNTRSIMKNSKGKNIKVFEYSISGIELLKGRKSNYFMVYATKKCLVGSECYAYTGLYNLNGNLIIEPYPYDSISVDFDSPIIRKRVNFFWGYSFDSLF
jgi:hypothetical protein